MRYLSVSLGALSVALVLMTLSACGSSKKVTEEYYTKHLIFPKEATIDQKVELASRLVPSEAQLRWQQLELTAFIHFGMNTFTGQEWGDGTEDPALYNPTNLDTDQWCASLKEAGFKMVILTAKHHDGFCLWDTKTTKHSVRYSPAWNGGEGDVMKKLRASCDKYGLRLGVYLSPWDRNSPVYGSGEGYNELYLEQLRELLTNYGQVDEVWFDGANGEGPNGKKQEYDWESVLSLIHELQPQAVTAIMGTDVRWVGNEKGLGRETEWSVTPLAPQSLSRADSIFQALNIRPTSQDLGSRTLLAKAGELFWYPSEVDVSIRPGWFFHPEEAPKTLATLINIYFSSVGMNSTLLLNIPPNKEGRLAEEDVARLKEFGDFIRAFYASEITTQTEPYSIDNTAKEPVVTIDLDPEKPFDAVLLQEDITKGQRIEAFEIEALIGDTWTKVGSGTTVGYKRIILLSRGPVTASKLRVTITEKRGDIHRLRVGAFLVPRTVSEYSSDAVPAGIPADEEWTAMVQEDGSVRAELNEPFKGFIFTPEEGNKAVRFIVKDKEGKVLLEDEMDNIINNPIPQTVLFPSAQDGSLTFTFFDITGAPTGIPLSALTLLK